MFPTLGVGNIPTLLDKSGILYLLRDEFLTDASAPLASPRTCEPGPGTLTILDTANKLSISAGGLRWSGVNVTFDPSIFESALRARTAGRAVIGLIRSATTSNIDQIGWSSNTTAVAASINLGRRGMLTFNQGLLSFVLYNGSVGVVSVGSLATNTDYQFAVVQRTSGYFAFVKGGAFTNWTLVWIDAFDSTASLNALITVGANQTGNSDYLRVTDLPAPFSTDALASLDQSSPVNSTDFTAQADGIFDLTFTAGTPLGAGRAYNRYRYQDANNYWTIYGFNDGAIYGSSVVAGVESVRVSVGSAITAGNTYTLRVIVEGTKHNFYYLNPSNVWTKIGAEINVSTAMDAVATLNPLVLGTGWSSSRLRSWPRISANYNGLSAI